MTMLPPIDTCGTGGSSISQLYEIELTCVSENDNLYVIQTDMTVTPPVLTIFDLAGSDVTGTVTPIVCPSGKNDVEYVCYQDIADPTIKYTRVDIWDTTVTPASLTGSVWLDASGAVVGAPANVEPCGDPQSNVYVVNACVLDGNGDPIGGLTVQHVNTIEAGSVTTTVRVVNDSDGSEYTLGVDESIGDCPCGQSYDTEFDFEILCDRLSDGTSVSFARQKTIDEITGNVVVEDFELDLTTPYTVQGTAGDCTNLVYYDQCWVAVTDGTGFVEGDVIKEIDISNPENVNNPIFRYALNRTQNTTLWAQINGVDVVGTLPNFGTDFDPCEQNYGEIADGVLVPTGTTFTLPANVISFTVTAQSGTFDVSFDGGGTYALTGRVGSRTWSQGTTEIVSNSTDIVITSNGDIDVIWEAR